jgi:5'-nucleotidase (lipoprotein e(P4) family)
MLALVPLLMIGCASAGTPTGQAATSEVAATAASASSTETVDLSLGAHWARNSAEHRAAYIQAYRAATERLEELAKGRRPGTWAVALDADETVVDNSQYEKELNQEGVTHSSERWSAWVKRAEAPPLPGALAFLARVRELGGHVAIVTNRRDDLCEATKLNFWTFDIPYDVILCRGESREKEPRWEMVRNGTASPDLPAVEILLWLGDNIGDFPNLDQETRFEPESAFEAFGDRYFVLPNAMYGSWQGNPKE